MIYMFFDYELDTSGVVGPRQWPLIDATAINIYSKRCKERELINSDTEGH